MSEESKRKLDVASLFPSKGDPRRPPEWYGRALFYAVIAVYLGWFVFTSYGKITYIVFDIVIALFLALAVEPLVIRLIRHGWKRGVASVTCLAGLLVIVIVLMALFGNMFVQQMISMVKGLPDLYNQFAAFVDAKTHFKLPEMNDLGGEIMKNIKGSWVTDFAGQAVSTTMGVLGQILNLTTALMVAFYISIAGPKLRRSVCQWIAPRSQRRFLMVCNRGAGSDFRVPVLAFHPRRDQCGLHVGVPDDHQGAVLAASGFVLRHCLAVRPDSWNLYRWRIAGAVRLG